MNKIKYLLLTLSLVSGATLPTLAAELGAQKSSERGVTVIVTPQSLSADVQSWDFKMVLDTHSQELSDDLVKSTVLIVAGNRYSPLSWAGAPPGGHHREGTLRFNAINPLPDKIELQILRTGEAKPRLYSWNLR